MKAESCPTHSVRCRFHFTLSYEVALVFCLVFKTYSIAGLISFLIQALESLMSILKMRKIHEIQRFEIYFDQTFLHKSSTKTYWFFSGFIKINFSEDMESLFRFYSFFSFSHFADWSLRSILCACISEHTNDEEIARFSKLT